jgi:hypothetical protein
MPIEHLCLLDRGGRLLLSYFLTPCAPAGQDRWEAALASSSREYWGACFAGDVPLVLGERVVLLRGRGELIFALTGSGVHDELGLLEPADAAVALVHACCDGAPSAERALAYHGKLRICVSEMFFAGALVCSDVELVLRNAKLKPPV